MLTKPTLIFWFRGIRLYIALGIVLFTLETWWWASAAYSGSLLFATRLEEVFAWTALALLALAITIGPFYALWPRFPAKKLLYEARRMLGLGAAWFSALHISIAYDSLFKFANPLSLPTAYQRAFILGALAMLILLAMAFTSFDKAVKTMGQWWFRLHRLVYLAVIIVLLHTLLIGAHATNWPALIILTILSVFIFGLHLWLAFRRSKRPSTLQLASLSAGLVFLVLIFSFGYHQRSTHDTVAGQHTPLPSSPEMQNTPGMNSLPGMESMPGMSQ